MSHSITDLFRAYETWAKNVGDHHPLGKVLFEERLLKAGCTKGLRKNGTVRAWIGVKLKLWPHPPSTDGSPDSTAKTANTGENSRPN